MLLLKIIAIVIASVFTLLSIVLYLLIWFGNNRTWRRNGDRNILLMLSSCDSYEATSNENIIRIKATNAPIEKGRILIFTFYRINNDIDIPPFTKSHKFITRLFKALNPGNDKAKEIAIFGEQVKNI
jgi:hypothetical protein